MSKKKIIRKWIQHVNIRRNIIKIRYTLHFTKKKSNQAMAEDCMEVKYFKIFSRSFLP